LHALVLKAHPIVYRLAKIGGKLIQQALPHIHVGSDVDLARLRVLKLNRV